eukprot:352642-Chlamydomonas_euryale.AAC.2
MKSTTTAATSTATAATTTTMTTTTTTTTTAAATTTSKHNNNNDNSSSNNNQQPTSNKQQPPGTIGQTGRGKDLWCRTLTTERLFAPAFMWMLPPHADVLASACGGKKEARQPCGAAIEVTVDLEGGRCAS